MTPLSIPLGIIGLVKDNKKLGAIFGIILGLIPLGIMASDPSIIKRAMHADENNSLAEVPAAVDAMPANQAPSYSDPLEPEDIRYSPPKKSFITRDGTYCHKFTLSMAVGDMENTNYGQSAWDVRARERRDEGIRNAIVSGHCNHMRSGEQVEIIGKSKYVEVYKVIDGEGVELYVDGEDLFLE